MRFPFRPIEAGKDVDAAALEEAGGLPLKDGSGKEREFYLDFWISPDARYRFANFAEGQGVSDALGMLDAAGELCTGGKPFMLELKHEWPKDAGGNADLTKPPFMRWDNPAPAE